MSSANRRKDAPGNDRSSRSDKKQRIEGKTECADKDQSVNLPSSVTSSTEVSDEAQGSAEKQEKGKAKVDPDGAGSHNAKQSAGPTSSSNFVVDKTSVHAELIEEYPSLTKQAARLVKFLTYANDDEHNYSLLRMPTTLVWEKVIAGKTSAANVLYSPLSSTPAMAWIVGEVTKRFFLDRNGNPFNQAAIHVRPLTSSSLNAAHALLHRIGAPQGTLDNMANEVRASCFRNKQGRGDRAASTIEFDNVYDARVEFRSKTGTKPMPSLDVSMLQDGDIVLVEATVNRYDRNYSKKDGDKKTDKQKLPPDWNYLFQLHSISLLFTPTDKPEMEDIRAFSGSM